MVNEIVVFMWLKGWQVGEDSALFFAASKSRIVNKG